MKHDARRQIRPSLQEQAEWVARFRTSGLGLRRFAREHGLRPNQLHYWVYQKRATPSDSAPVFKEVKLAELFPNHPWAAEMELPGGQTLRVKASASPVWVAELIQNLRELC